MKCLNNENCKCDACKKELKFINKCRKTASEMSMDEINVKRLKYFKYKKYPKTPAEFRNANLSSYWASVWVLKESSK